MNVRSLDGTVDRTFGGYGDIQYAPAFLDRDTLMALRRVVSLAKSGTELLFESVKTGKVLRSVPLTSGSESVTAWQIDPLHQHIVFSTQQGVTFHTYVLSLVDGSKTSLPDGGDDPLWMP